MTEREERPLLSRDDFIRWLRGEGVETSVVAPAAPGLEDHERIEGVDIERFRYAPRRYETLAYTGNMAQQFQASWSARVTMLGFLGSEFRSAVRARREAIKGMIAAARLQGSRRATPRSPEPPRERPQPSYNTVFRWSAPCVAG